MSKKQTAVEYLMEMIRLNDKEFYAMLFEDKVFDKANEMFYEQIVESNYDGQSLHAKSVTKQMMIDNAESYYNETFNNI